MGSLTPAGKLQEQFPGSVVEWKYPENEKHFRGHRTDPIPPLYWIALVLAAFCGLTKRSTKTIPFISSHMRAKGYYDWPAWDHPERRTLTAPAKTAARLYSPRRAAVHR